MTYAWHDLAGNLGVVLILGCYLFNQTSQLATRGVAYSLLNGIGAALVLVSLWFHFNLSAFLIELAWLAISAYGLTRAVLEVRRG